MGKRVTQWVTQGTFASSGVSPTGVDYRRNCRVKAGHIVGNVTNRSTYIVGNVTMTVDPIVGHVTITVGPIVGDVTIRSVLSSGML